MSDKFPPIHIPKFNKDKDVEPVVEDKVSVVEVSEVSPTAPEKPIAEVVEVEETVETSPSKVEEAKENAEDVGDTVKEKAVEAKYDVESAASTAKDTIEDGFDDLVQKNKTVLNKIKSVSPAVKIGVVATVLVILALISFFIFGGGSPKVSDDESPISSEQSELAYPVTGRDGDVVFTVNGAVFSNTAGDRSSGMFVEPSNGQFVLITLNMTNLEGISKMYSPSAQRVILADGTDTAANTTASMYLNPTITRVEPGQTVTIVEAFDVPEDAEVKGLEAHESMISPGVKLGVPHN